MFDIKQWLADAPKSSDFELQVGTQTFKCRRLNGLQRERYNVMRDDSRATTSPRAYLLSCCLIDDRTSELVSYVDAVQFVDKYDFLSLQLEVAILERTGEIIEAESDVWRIAEKNSGTINTDTSTGSGAATST